MNYRLFLVAMLMGASLAGCASGAGGAEVPANDRPPAEQPPAAEPEGPAAEAPDDAEAAEDAANDAAAEDAAEAAPEGSIVYENSEYGFRFALPSDWEGYTIVEEKWEGLSLEEAEQGAVAASGPQLSIRHPQWTAEQPRQDIPILVFTAEQWEQLTQEKFHIGAAPILPKELGRNAEYVFALPARYNFAFPEGYEEVEEILESNPLQPIE